MPGKLPETGRAWESRCCPWWGERLNWAAGFDPWDIRPVHLAARLTCPLFLAHGDLDALIPLSHLHQLAEAAGTHVKMVMEVPGGTHGGVFIAGGDSLWGASVVFFVRELGGNGV